MPKMSRLAEILAEVESERDHQIDKWGVDTDDLVNTPMDFVGYIARHSTLWFPGGFKPYKRSTLAEFRRQMVKVATLAVAAIEYTDRLLDGANSRADVFDNSVEQ